MNDWFDAEQHVERAHELYEAGRWDEAERELREALTLNPHRAEWHFNLGLTLEAAGRFEDALKAFGEAHALEPGDVQAMVSLGVNALRLERAEEAIGWFERAQRVEPGRADTYIHRIEAYARLGQHESAETMYYLAQQCEEGDQALALANLSDSLMDRGLHEKAIWCLREAAHLDPRLPGVHARLGAAYAATGRHERARQMYLRELRERPGCVDTLLDFGDLLAQMGRPTEAAEKYRRALEQESDNAEAHMALGELALKQGNDREALASLRAAERIDPELPGVRRRIAAALMRRGEVAEARRRLRADLRALRREGTGFGREERMELGNLLLDAGLTGDAAEVFRGVVSMAPGDAAGWHHLSVASFLQGERMAGERAARWALRGTMEPAVRVSALHNLALSYYETKRWGHARACVRRGLAVDGTDAGLRRLRSLLRVRRVGAVVAGVVRRRRR